MVFLSFWSGQLMWGYSYMTYLLSGWLDTLRRSNKKHMSEITKDDLTIVKFSNNTIAVGNKNDIDFIDYILDICQINKLSNNKHKINKITPK